MDLNSLNFMVWVVVENVGVDGREFDGMMNEESETTTIIIARTIMMRQRISWK